jgi:hypothetical protein
MKNTGAKASGRVAGLDETGRQMRSEKEVVMGCISTLWPCAEYVSAALEENSLSRRI